MLTVTGTATDPEGVANVFVNGASATITNPVSSRSGRSVANSDGNGDTHWSAEVVLESGVTSISVSVEDVDGDVTSETDSTSVSYFEVPFNFTLDPDRTRVVGLSYSPFGPGPVQTLVEHDYSTQEQTLYTGVNSDPALSCFRRFEDEFIYASFSTGTWELRKFDLAAREDSVLAEFPDSILEGGAAFQAGSPRRMVCGGTSTSAYVLVNFIPIGGGQFEQSRIVEIDLATAGFSILSETDPMAPSPWIANPIALAADQIVTMEDINPVSPLTSVSLADGSRTELASGLNVGGFELHPELGSDRIYVATFDGVDEVDLVAGTKRNVSEVEDDDPLRFAQVRSIGFDGANNRVVVGDEDLDALIAVDVTTGERSVLLNRSVGEGIALIAPRRIVLSEDETRAWVLDDGGNVTERLFEIDLATGDRRTIGDLAQPFNVFASGLAIDETAGLAYVAFVGSVQEVDLETGNARMLLDAGSSPLENINDLLLDATNDRLLIADAVGGGIYALDPGTGVVDVVSKAGVAGDGPGFGAPVSLDWAPGEATVFAGDPSVGAIFRVDLETGNRERIDEDCENDGPFPDQGLRQALYDDRSDELLAFGDFLFSIDVESGACRRVSDRPASMLRLVEGPGNQFLALDFRAILQYNRQTGESVIFSK